MLFSIKDLSTKNTKTMVHRTSIFKKGIKKQFHCKACVVGNIFKPFSCLWAHQFYFYKGLSHVTRGSGVIIFFRFFKKSDPVRHNFGRNCRNTFYHKGHALENISRPISCLQNPKFQFYKGLSNLMPSFRSIFLAYCKN